MSDRQGSTNLRGLQTYQQFFPGKQPEEEIGQKSECNKNGKLDQSLALMRAEEVG